MKPLRTMKHQNYWITIPIISRFIQYFFIGYWIIYFILDKKKMIVKMNLLVQSLLEW